MSGVGSIRTEGVNYGPIVRLIGYPTEIRLARQVTSLSKLLRMEPLFGKCLLLAAAKIIASSTRPFALVLMARRTVVRVIPISSRRYVRAYGTIAAHGVFANSSPLPLSHPGANSSPTTHPHRPIPPPQTRFQIHQATFSFDLILGQPKKDRIAGDL